MSSDSFGKRTPAYQQIMSHLQDPIPIIITTTSEVSPKNEVESSIGSASVRAYLKKPAAPGVMLDCVGSVLGEIAHKSKLIVTTAVFFQCTNVLVGVCSDKLLRFWDVATGCTLCSCRSDEGLVDAAEEVRVPSDSKDGTKKSKSATLQMLKVHSRKLELVHVGVPHTVRIYLLTLIANMDTRTHSITRRHLTKKR